jgi:D-xylose transport system substrate-binding protein
MWTRTEVFSAPTCFSRTGANGVLAALEKARAEIPPIVDRTVDRAAFNRIALGTEFGTVWTNRAQLARLAAMLAVELTQGRPVHEAADVSVVRDRAQHTFFYRFVEPHGIDPSNLDRVLAAGAISKDELCSGVPRGQLSVCN